MENIKQLIVIGVALLFVYGSDVLLANSNTILNKNNISQIQIGDYLRNDYIESIKKYSSTSKAYKYDSPQLITITKYNDEISIKVIFNFHEAGILLALNKSGKIITKSTGGINIDNLELEFIDSNNIKFGVGKHKTMTYHFVGSSKNYVANKILSGEYKDDNGNTYIFKKDGWAIFPNNTFRYEVGLDHVEIPYNYYRNKKDSKIYAFEMENSVLKIFATEGEESEIVQKEPLIVVKKTRGI